MEFQFRAGEDKPPSLYSDDFFAYPTMGGFATHPKPTLEELKRQLEEERLKEEILKRRIAQRRMIEEELRRESEMMKMMMMMTGKFQHIPIITPLKVMEPQDGFGGKFPLWKEAEFNSERSPLDASPSELPFSHDHDETKETSEKLAGTKRKAPGSLSAIGNYKFPQSSLKKDWSCALCEVTMASEDELNKHLKGEKHIGLVTELSSGMMKTAGPTTKDNSPSSSASVKSPIHMDQSQRQGVKKVCLLPNRQMEDEDDSEKNEQTKEVIQKGIYLWCMICGVKCTSQIDLDKHLSGKKHYRLLKFKKSGWKAAEEVERLEEVEVEVEAVAKEEEEEGGDVVETEN